MLTRVAFGTGQTDSSQSVSAEQVVHGSAAPQPTLPPRLRARPSSGGKRGGRWDYLNRSRPGKALSLLALVVSQRTQPGHVSVKENPFPVFVRLRALRGFVLP